MKKIVVPVLAAAFAASMSLAQAATMDGEGVIQTISAAPHTVVLKDGKTLQLAKGVSLSDLKAGESVSYKYEMKDGKIAVSQIQKAAN